MDEFIIEQANALLDLSTDEYEFCRLVILMRVRAVRMGFRTKTAEDVCYLARLVFGIADRLRPLLLEGSTT